MPPNGTINPKCTYILGVDFARMGQDKSVFLVIEKDWHTGNLYVVWTEETKHKKLTDAIGRILVMDRNFHFKKIILDTTGLGAGPTDILKERLGGKVEGITFSLQSKQDLYSNLKILMEAGRIKLPNHKDLLFQLMDLRYQVSSSGNLKIHHSERGHDDYPDALALACWFFKGKRAYVPHIA